MSSVLQRGVEKITESGWLDGPADWLDETFNRIMSKAGDAERKVRDLLHGKWQEHPLHPVLTDIPTGAWTAAFFMDLLGSGDDENDPNYGADACIAIGLAGAAGAAATGLADWQPVRNPRVRRIGVVHAGLNVLATGLYATSLALRWTGNRPLGRRVAYLGSGVVTVSAYLGGQLVYGEKMGVSHAPADGPHDFIPLIDESAFGEGPQKVMADGVPVMLARRNGQVFAISDECSHLGCSLSAGRLDGDTITCRCHGSAFDLRDGSVVTGPATFPATPFETRVRDGKIEVRVQR